MRESDWQHGRIPNHDGIPSLCMLAKKYLNIGGQRNTRLTYHLCFAKTMVVLFYFDNSCNNNNSITFYVLPSYCSCSCRYIYHLFA